MKMTGLIALIGFLMVAGVTLAQQSEEEKKSSSMQDRMEQMMKHKQSGASRTEGMGGMMGMMKMMEQCSDMMKSNHDRSEKPKEGQNR